MAEMKAQAGLESLQQKIQEAMNQAQTAVNRELEQFQASQAQAPTGGLDATTLLNWVTQFNDADSQVGLLNLLIESVEQYVPRSMLLIRKGSAVHGWAGCGFSEDFMAKQLKRVKWPLDQYPEISRVIDQGTPRLYSFSDLSDISDQISAFDGFVPLKSCFFPIRVKNKIAAILYCDTGSEPRMENQDLIEILTRIAGTELTLVTSKLKKAKKPAKSEAPAPEPPAPAPTPEPEPAPVAAPKPVELPQLTELPSEPSSFGSGTDTSFDSDQFGGGTSLPSFETQAIETQALANQAMEPQPTPAPVVSSSQSEDPSIKKAKRVARVLVSDLKLYNESTVETGCRNNDLYLRLKEDIDRSYKHYQERVSSLISDPKTNYFKDELIKQLAGGDAEKLGPLPY